MRRAGNGLPSAGPPPGRRRNPVIAAVNGAAVGIGATMLLPMDLRLAAEDARFGFVFTRRSLVPQACSGCFLPRLVGIDRTLEWAFTGRVFDAAEAVDGALVRRVLPADALLPAAQAPAREIADHAAPVSVALTRQRLWRMLGAPHPMSAHRIDSRALFARGRSDGAREGVGALPREAPRALQRPRLRRHAAVVFSGGASPTGRDGTCARSDVCIAWHGGRLPTPSTDSGTLQPRRSRSTVEPRNQIGAVRRFNGKVSLKAT